MKKWIAILVGVLLIVVPLLAEAKARCPAKPKNVVRAKRMAKKFFNKGGRLAQKEKYSAALDSFLCSLKMKPHENTVYNVAQVSKFVEDRESVSMKLEGFLDKHPDHESRPELEELIASVEGSYQPPPADQPPTPDPIPPSDISSDTSDESPVDELVEEEPDDEVGELFAEDADDPTEEPTAAAPEAEDGERAPPTTIAGYVLLGTAGATLITAIGLQGAAGAAKNKALDSQNYDQFTSREDKMGRLQTGATVFWVATGLIGGTGVVLLLLDSHEGVGGEDEVDLALGAAPTGVVLRGRF